MPILSQGGDLSGRGWHVRVPAERPGSEGPTTRASPTYLLSGEDALVTPRALWCGWWFPGHVEGEFLLQFCVMQCRLGRQALTLAVLVLWVLCAVLSVAS
jgi:hypothetical protein